jgi:hypothetical protein
MELESTIRAFGELEISMNSVIGLKTITLPLLIAVSFACLALPPPARAVCQQGCDGSNTFLGDDALLNNTTGFGNTAIGWLALHSNTASYD